MTVSAERSPAEPARKNLPICVLDDEVSLVEITADKLEKAGFPAVGTSDPDQALQKVRTGGCRVVLADIKTRGMDGLAFLQRVQETDPGIYVILVTASYSVDSAIDAIKRGAYDYFCKPLDYDRLLKSLDELARIFAQRLQIRELEEKILTNLEFHGIVGKSPAMLEMFDLVRKVARHYTNALISGPTGSGKELVARALHEMSPVAQGRFGVCNCSAVAGTPLESQLFGHIRGASTGASDTRPGLFEYANGGTIFLDEVGEMSLAMQAELLRVIQNREIQRVGSPEAIKVNVRLIAATNRDLRAEVLARRFREDLFYRFSTIEMRVPSLADRRDDIPLLVLYFLKKNRCIYGKALQGLTRRAQVVLMHHDWPGNVRELENVISSSAVTAASDFIDVGDLPEHLQKPSSRGESTEENWRPLPLQEVRRIHIQRVLEACNGNRVRASQILGIGRTSLYRYIKRMNQRPAGKTAA